MKFNIIVHDLKTIEVYDNAEEMINRIVELTSEMTFCRRKPTHLAVDETGMTIIIKNIIESK